MTLPSTFVELCRTILIFAYCFYNIHMLQCHHKLTMLFSTKAKNPRTAFRGFFYSVLLWRLNPQANGRIRKRSPDFQMGFCHIRRQPPTPTKKAGPDILLSCHFSYLLSSVYFFIFRISTASASLPDTYTALPAQTPELPASSAVCHSPPSYVHIPELRHNILPGILYLH